MVVFLSNSPFSTLVLTIQTDCINKMGYVADFCAPD